ncbi:MAG: hypothetical protein D6797_03380 [Bdellovibrio sp.]|nr:MAG: hypothetical protein D6797_03380 [Bdellovibrio sp.]
MCFFETLKTKAKGAKEGEMGQNKGEGFQERRLTSVPTPNQMPPKISLEGLPKNILRSGAVNILIQQNEDLMARLSVSLRRISLLEEANAKLERENLSLQHKNSNLADRIFLLEEKEKALKERFQKDEVGVAQLKEQLKLREIEFSEYYSQSQERQKELLKKVESLSKRLARFLRYRKRVQMAARHQKQKTQKELALKNADLLKAQERVQSLEEELFQEAEKNKHLKKQVEESTEYIQSQAKQFKVDQQKLVDHYEEQLGKLHQKIKDLESQNEELVAKNRENEMLYEKNVELENQLVVEKRRQEDVKETLEKEIKELQLKLSQERGTAKAKTLELERAQKDLVEQHQTLMSLKKEKDQLEDQVENLQCLWRDSHAELEKQKEKNKALQKLNQQMSLKMNEYRKEIHDLKMKLETSQVLTAHQVKELKGQVKAVTQLMEPKKIKDQNHRSSVGDQNSQGGDKDFTPDLMNRIDELIGEIHTAFNIQPSAGKEQEPPAEVPNELS